VADRDGITSVPPDHATHDLELVVALLDADQPAADRTAAEALVRSCSACASLHQDLLDLASATAALPVTPRSRDFSLSPEVAASLRGASNGEPVPARARLTGDMTVPRTAHAAHDQVLIANLIDRSPSDAERARGEAQMAACRECERLHEDLLALSAATRAMPVPSRPRDFALTAADAERLRVRGWRRVLAAIGSSRDAFSRPLAIGFTTLGIAGLLVATIPSALPGLGGSATSLSPAEDAARSAAGTGNGAAGANPEFLAQSSGAPEAASAPAIAAAGPTSAPSEAPAPAAAAPPELTPEVLVEGGEAGSAATEPQDQGAFDTYQKSFAPTEPAGPSPLLIVAALLLLAGLSLFTLRWTARRLGDG
jgi:hypothetical protein